LPSAFRSESNAHMYFVIVRKPDDEEK